MAAIITNPFDLIVNQDDPTGASSPSDAQARLNELCDEAQKSLEAHMHTLDDPRMRFSWLKMITEHRLVQPVPHEELAGRILHATADADPDALESALLAVGRIVPTEKQLLEWSVKSTAQFALAQGPPPNPLTWGDAASWPPYVEWCDEYFKCQQSLVMPSVTWWTGLWLLALNPKTDHLWSTTVQVRQVQVLEMMLKFQFGYDLAQYSNDDDHDINDIGALVEDLSNALAEMINHRHNKMNFVVPFRWDLFAAVFNFVSAHVPVTFDQLFYGGLARRSIHVQDTIITSHLAVVRLIHVLGHQQPHYEGLVMHTSRKHGAVAINPAWAHGMAPQPFDTPRWATARPGFFASAPMFLTPTLHDHLLKMAEAANEDEVPKLIALIRHLRACEFGPLGERPSPMLHDSGDECAHHWADHVIDADGTSSNLNMRALLDRSDPAPDRAHWKSMAWKRKRAARVRLLQVWFGLMVEVQKQRRKRAMLAPDGAWGKAFTDARQDLDHWNQAARKEARLE